MRPTQVIAWLRTPNQHRMGLWLPEAIKALGQLLGEEGIANIHSKLYPRAYHRLKAKKLDGTIKSLKAKEAFWKRIGEVFKLGEFDPQTESLISDLICMTYAALNESGQKNADLKEDYRKNLERFTDTLMAADAHQIPAGTDMVRAGVFYRRALVKQIRVDHLCDHPNCSTLFPIKEEEEVSAAIADATTSLGLLKNDQEAGHEDRFNRVLILLVALLHRHRKNTLGLTEYKGKLEELKVIDRLFTAVRSVRRHHPRAVLLADNLVHLCSYLEHPNTREAYIYLCAFDDAYLKNPTHTVATDKSAEDDNKYLLKILKDKPVSEQEIKECNEQIEKKEKETNK
jgi:hypothetical protein